jgi:hypothetical protein
LRRWCLPLLGWLLYRALGGRWGLLALCLGLGLGLRLLSLCRRCVGLALQLLR